MKIGITKVYYGGGRRWLTLKAACNAEAKTRLKERACCAIASTQPEKPQAFPRRNFNSVTYAPRQQQPSMKRAAPSKPRLY